MVHWNRQKTRNILLMQITGLLFTILTFILLTQQDGAAEGQLPNLQIESAITMPLKELSGIHWRNTTRGLELVAIGDKKAELAIMDMASGEIRKESFRDLILDQFSLCAHADNSVCAKFLKKILADWEAIRIDGSGRIYLLQEHSEAVIVLDPNLDRIPAVLNFNLLEMFPEKAKKSGRKFPSNALGEGLLLMNQGHFVVAKESAPMALIEFGPEGSIPMGLHGSTVLAPGKSFELPTSGKNRHRYKALAYWDLAADGKCDFSDIEFARGQIFVLSQRCQRIIVFDSLTPKHGELRPSATYALPSVIKNPEALAVLPDGRLVVGSDIRSKKDNVFILKSPFAEWASSEQKDLL
ncbi:hypothetical protein [Pseudobacteriovorax antillogorgiicola]|uniref:Esterase-like activity of phytase n=1 Tax=Pseudobacteriovorax antillogorgiicola TaxID=1513793 RepID=A0A1Y6CE79_9BACT|nr:hypothetical protein [Pseudobacteriovorax antillogorgiicola]TCS51736.1 hypothetical protein EDD56_110121 [Pseudobacteriovorax antillogorgiicola]SMF49600.1 hypothetical protein SAMN06296036_11590 [Pseudobacteriovorax antillogorgiicola]